MREYNNHMKLLVYTEKKQFVSQTVSTANVYRNVVAKHFFKQDVLLGKK